MDVEHHGGVCVDLPNAVGVLTWLVAADGSTEPIVLTIPKLSDGGLATFLAEHSTGVETIAIDGRYT